MRSEYRLLGDVIKLFRRKLRLLQKRKLKNCLFKCMSLPKNVKSCYFYAKYTVKLLIAFKIAFLLLQPGGNVGFQDFLQKRFIILTLCLLCLFGKIFFIVGDECDQMPILFVHYLQIYNNENFPMSKKCQHRLKCWPNNK